MTMPSADGCFLRVWDAPQLGGLSDFINGPRDYSTLRDLPGGRIWSNRIMSAYAGPAATVTLWTDENFQGARLALQPDTTYRSLPQSMSGQTESINIVCPNVTTD